MRGRNSMPSHFTKNRGTTEYYSGNFWCMSVIRMVSSLNYETADLTADEADKADELCHNCQNRFFAQFKWCRLDNEFQYEPIKPVLALAQKGNDCG